jgi:saccharopine dehydrogenase (NAD+, L-lysine-forming)
MRILLIGAGGVGSAVVPIAARRDFFEQVIVCDYVPERARRAVDRVGDHRFVAVGRSVDAGDRATVEALVRATGATHVLNAVDPRFVLPIFEAALAAGADYLDMAMSLSRPHPERPYELRGVKLGDEQFARAVDWEAAGRLALVGIGRARVAALRRRPSLPES